MKMKRNRKSIADAENSEERLAFLLDSSDDDEVAPKSDGLRSWTLG